MKFIVKALKSFSAPRWGNITKGEPLPEMTLTLAEKMEEAGMVEIIHTVEPKVEAKPEPEQKVETKPEPEAVKKATKKKG